MEQAQDGIEQTGLERFALGGAIGADGRPERRDEMGEVGPRRPDDRLELGRIQLLGEVAEGLDERRVRHAPVADVGAAADQDAHPAADAIVATSATSRDFPTPASPAMSWWIGDPAMARSSARPIAACSVARPTSVGLTRRRDIAR